MKAYMIGEIHKLEVIKNERDFTVRFFEKMGGRWVQLGPEEYWTSIDDIKWAYDID
jgi:hypothetical protein